MAPVPSQASNAPFVQQVVSGKRLMRAGSDIYLIWTSFGGRDSSARQLHDMMCSPEVETMDHDLLSAYVELCVATLARLHVRRSELAQISGSLSNRDIFDQAIASFTEVYANQAEPDHEAGLSAILEGHVRADLHKGVHAEGTFPDAYWKRCLQIPTRLVAGRKLNA